MVKREKAITDAGADIAERNANRKLAQSPTKIDAWAREVQVGLHTQSCNFEGDIRRSDIEEDAITNRWHVSGGKFDVDGIVDTRDGDRLIDAWEKVVGDGVEADGNFTRQIKPCDSEDSDRSSGIKRVERASRSIDFHQSDGRAGDEKTTRIGVEAAIGQLRNAFADEDEEISATCDREATAIGEAE